MYQSLAAELPDVPHYRSRLARTSAIWPPSAKQSEKHDEAEQLALQSLEIVDKLATDYPEVPEYQSGGLSKRGCSWPVPKSCQGKVEEARVLLEPTIAQPQGALKSNPDNPEYHVVWLRPWMNSGW